MLGHLARDRRDGYAHALGRTGEAAGLDDSGEGRDRGESVHSLLLQ